MPALWVTFLLTLGTVIGLQENCPQDPVTDKIKFAFNEGFPSFSPESLQLISFGYPRFLSNLLWLRFLQQTPTQKVNDNEISWIYFDLDAISTIDPDFLPVFEHAAIFLSVVTTDKKGAQLLLEKGTRLHPNNWRIHAYLAYHYQFELNMPDKAGEQYLLASKSEESPILVKILAAKYLAKIESFDSGINFLEELRDNAKEEITKQRFQTRIDLLKKNRNEREKP